MGSERDDADPNVQDDAYLLRRLVSTNQGICVTQQQAAKLRTLMI